MAEAGIIRKKIASQRADHVDGGPGADRGWRLGLARAARDLMKISLDVRSLTVERRSLAELAELVPDRALIAVLDGPAEGMGAIILSQPILAGFIEAQTIGRIRSQDVNPRKPTRTDAAMVVGIIDAALTALEQVLAEEADLVWAGGFRYASFLDDPRPLTLLLEDIPLRLLRAEVALAGGLRVGEILLALPAEGRGARPALLKPDEAPADHAHVFATGLCDRVNGAAARVEAVLARLTMPLAQVMALAEGMILPLQNASIDRISLEGLDGRRVGEGRLGQNRGMRAVRLVEKGSQSGQETERAVVSDGSEIGMGTGIGDFPALDFPAMGDISHFLATGTN